MDMDNFIDKTEPLRTLTIEIFRFKLCNVIDEMNSHNDCFFFLFEQNSVYRIPHE